MATAPDQHRAQSFQSSHRHFKRGTALWGGFITVPQHLSEMIVAGNWGSEWRRPLTVMSVTQRCSDGKGARITWKIKRNGKESRKPLHQPSGDLGECLSTITGVLFSNVRLQPLSAMFIVRANPFSSTVKRSPSYVPLLLSAHQNGAEMWRAHIGLKKLSVWVTKMNETYRLSLDSAEMLYEWNVCVLLHYAVFKWPLSICSCAIRSTRSHFQRRLREVCSACLLIMQHPELNCRFYFFRGKTCSVEPFKHI